MHDVIIVGGSYAGLAAALQLGRARRSVLVIDAGQRRNRFAKHSHGFLGQDGQPGAAIAAKGRSEVLAYPTVTWREATVTDVRAAGAAASPGGVAGDGFVVVSAGEELRAKRVILATGVTDELPPIAGLAERWGVTIFHCPYCDGYERNLGRLGVLASSELSIHQAILVSEWGRTTLFTNGAFEPNAAELAELAQRGIDVEPARVESAAGEAPMIELCLQDGRIARLDGLFVAPRAVLQNDFATRLGCELEAGPVGLFLKTDAKKETTVPGVFACGDVASPMPLVALAVADGVRAGASAHQSLVFRR